MSTEHWYIYTHTPIEDNPWTDPVPPRLLFSLPLPHSPVNTLTLLLCLSSSKRVLGHIDSVSFVSVSLENKELAEQVE